MVVCNWSDAVCQWPGGRIYFGLLDTSFIASHSYYHHLANLIYIYAGNHRYHLKHLFPESILLYILNFKTLPLDMEY
jgi:hypothetical protein